MYGILKNIRNQVKWIFTEKTIRKYANYSYLAVSQNIAFQYLGLHGVLCIMGGQRGIGYLPGKHRNFLLEFDSDRLATGSSHTGWFSFATTCGFTNRQDWWSASHGLYLTPFGNTHVFIISC